MNKFYEEDALQTFFLQLCKINNLRESTLLSYHKAFSIFSHYVGDMDYENITEQTVKFFHDINFYSNESFNHQRAKLNAYFNYLVDKEYIKDNPIKTIPIKKRKVKENPRPAKKEDIQKILSSLDLTAYRDLRDFTFYLFIADTGIRPHEAVQVQLKNINIKKKRIVVEENKSKTGEERTLFLSDKVMEYIVRLILENQELFPTCDFLFINQYGKQATTNIFRKRLKELCEENNCKFTPYQLRHYFGTTYHDNGVDLFYIQNMMGHKDIRTTKKYVKLNEEKQQEIHRKNSPADGLL